MTWEDPFTGEANDPGMVTTDARREGYEIMEDLMQAERKVIEAAKVWLPWAKSRAWKTIEERNLVYALEALEALKAMEE